MTRLPSMPTGKADSRARRGALFILLSIIGVTAPWDSLRAGSVGSATDIVLLLTIALVGLRTLAGGPRLRLNPYLPVLLWSSLIAVGGLVGTVMNGASSGGLLNLFRFLTATIGLATAFSGARLDFHHASALARAYVVGASVSATYALLLPSVRIGGRASGLSLHPNALGLTCAFAFALSLGFLSNGSKVERHWSGGAIGVLLGGVSVSGSRAAFLATVIATLAFLALTRRFRLLLAGGAISVFALLALGSGVWDPPAESAFGRLLSSSETARQSDRAREAKAAEVTERIDQNLVTGSGFEHATQAHNVYLQIVDTAGLLGVIAMPVLLVGIVRRPWRRRRDPTTAGSIAAFASYLGAAAVSNALWDRWLWFPVMVMIAQAACGSETQVRSKVEEENRNAAPSAEGLQLETPT